MDKSELEGKYQKLATEYSKVRSQATVLRKAVLDEQATILNLKEIIKEQEQKIRKHDQEMESLTFRNEQLTKRISVLQQDLQGNQGKKNKIKGSENSTHQSNFSIIDEELQKKIIENAELASTMADKDLELMNYKDNLEWMRESFVKLETELNAKCENYKVEVEKMEKEISKNAGIKNINKVKDCDKCRNNNENSITHVKQEAERWKMECEALRSRPNANSELTEYYESQIRNLLELKLLCQSEANSLHADNEALIARLENAILEKNSSESILEKTNEELHTTSENYKMQFDAMTEHFAAQNEKITKQCDEIEMLKHKLNAKK
ncbi:PREDICTED: protein phosphatase 1 regulatory subunit 21 [Nicrophorus vespilloides]|uniref:Protein phosphatase 1 regulatory subunit 21 n=1 Tax=Nicrophorus vespilloides TaxID=110193 RepID=A0ABM1MG69_NICVS|nr:PREDICTED: protein phosphatase 1 regulatory subunit 21 [Nicrophorus vespilloides]